MSPICIHPEGAPHWTILPVHGNLDRAHARRPRVCRPRRLSLRDREELTSFLSLDYLYTPSQDVGADARLFSEVLGGKIAFAVEGMGARVAMIELTAGPPHVLLTDHLEGDRPIFVYRVDDLKKSAAALKRRGAGSEHRLELPMGPCASFTLRGGHRIALYEESRPQVLRTFLGRHDF